MPCKGWIKKWEGPESFDKTEPNPPPEALKRLCAAWVEVLGGEAKADSPSGDEQPRSHPQLGRGEGQP